jgi:hypothetical protein
MPPNSASCLTRSRSRSPRSSWTEPMTRTVSAISAPNIPRRPRLSCRRARPQCPVHRPKPIQPSATAISRSLPSAVGWAGSEPRATMSGPAPRGDQPIQADHRRHLALAHPTGAGGRNPDCRQGPQPNVRPRTPRGRPRRLMIKEPSQHSALAPPCTTASDRRNHQCP